MLIMQDLQELLPRGQMSQPASQVAFSIYVCPHVHRYLSKQSFLCVLVSHTQKSSLRLLKKNMNLKKNSFWPGQR